MLPEIFLAQQRGSDPALKPILFGSHIDSVLSGGNFDGDVGSMSAIEVLHTLKEHGVTTRHPLQMVIWTDEENTFAGQRCCRRAIVSRRPQTRKQRNFNRGRHSQTWRRSKPGWPTRASLPGAIRCYLELHIEQGGVLDKANVPIGVVEGIVSIDRYEVEIHGFANHAGTTPMKERRNALLAAAKLIEAVQDVVMREPGRQVGTVGQVWKCSPTLRTSCPAQ